MNEASEMKPISVRMALANPFSCLECVNDVWQIVVRVRLVDEVVQAFKSLHHSHLKSVESAPFLHLYTYLHILNFMDLKMVNYLASGKIQRLMRVH